MRRPPRWRPGRPPPGFAAGRARPGRHRSGTSRSPAPGPPTVRRPAGPPTGTPASGRRRRARGWPGGRVSTRPDLRVRRRCHRRSGGTAPPGSAHPAVAVDGATGSDLSLRYAEHHRRRGDLVGVLDQARTDLTQPVHVVLRFRQPQVRVRPDVLKVGPTRLAGRGPVRADAGPHVVGRRGIEVEPGQRTAPVLPCGPLLERVRHLTVGIEARGRGRHPHHRRLEAARFGGPDRAGVADGAAEERPEREGRHDEPAWQRAAAARHHGGQACEQPGSAARRWGGGTRPAHATRITPSFR